MTALGIGVKVRCISMPNKLCPADLPSIGCIYTISAILSVFPMIALAELPNCAQCIGPPYFFDRHFQPIDDEGDAEILRLANLIRDKILLPA